MKYWRKLLTNRALIILSTLLFVAWLMLWNENNMGNLKQVESNLEKAIEERDYYREIIQKDSAVIMGLQDSAYLERFARENYFYTKEGENLYLIENQTK